MNRRIALILLTALAAGTLPAGVYNFTDGRNATDVARVIRRAPLRGWRVCGAGV